MKKFYWFLKAKSYLVLALVLALLFAMLVSPSALAGPILLDPSFDGDGKVTTAFGTSSEIASAVALQPDGKIIVAGSANLGTDFDFALARYNGDGSLDTTFFVDGRRTIDFFGFNDSGEALALQPDGKIIVAGSAYNPITGDDDFALARFNSDGNQDFTFGTNGKVNTDFGGFFGTRDHGYAVAVQPDGKIIVAGESSQGSSLYNDFAVARYNSNGSLDTSFSTDGKLIAGFNGPDSGYALALQPDGKIVVAGSSDVAGNADFALLRLNSNGSADTTFNGGGIVTTDFFFGSTDIGYAVALQPDGKIVVAGSSHSDFALTRYNSDGSPDSTFGGIGTETTDFNRSNDSAQAIVIRPDGKIILAGSSQASFGAFKVEFALARYTKSGYRDSTFDNDGRLTTPIGTDDVGFDVALQPDGKIIVAGTSNNGSNSDFALARYLGEGATFADVPTDYWAWYSIELIYSDGITSGCVANPVQYCPEASVTRAQMAVFLGHMRGSTPPPATGTVFADVPASHWAAAWIEKLAADGITGGCGGGRYCPENNITRAQMAVFLLRTKYGAGYTPPAVGNSTGFSDVPTGYWAAAWIKQLAAEGITSGCGTGMYCPESLVTRAQMAVFLVRALWPPELF